MKIGAYIVGLLLLAGIVGYGVSIVRKASRVDVAEARAEAAEKGRASDMAEVVKRLDDDAKQRGELLTKLGAIDQRFNDIKIPNPGQLIQSKEKPGDPCPVPSLGPEFYRVFNASSAAGSAATETR